MSVSQQKQPSDKTVKRVYQSLKQLAREKGPDFKLPTTRDLCARFSTNMVNVNNALRELEAQDLITRRQGSGIYVSPNVNRTRIAVLLDHAFFSTPGTSPFWGMLWGLLALEAERRSRAMNQDGSFHLILPREKGEPPLPEFLVRSLEMEQIHGVIGIGLETRLADWLISSGVPFVAFAGYAHLQVHGVPNAAVQLGVAELARHGCRRVALLVPGEAYRPERWSETSIIHFENALAEHGIPFDPEIVIDFRRMQSLAPPYFSAHGTHQEQGFSAIMKLFGDGGTADPPDGLVIGDDVMTSGAIAALHDLGLRLWDDVKIVSHMNIGSPTLFHYEKRLIGIATDPAEIVSAVHELLDQALAGGVTNRQIDIIGQIRLPA